MATQNLKPAALSFEGILSFDMLFSMLYFTMKKCRGLSIHDHCFSSLVPLLSNNFRLATNFVLYLCHWYFAKVFGFKSLKRASPSFSNPVLFHLFNTGCYSLVSYISIQDKQLVSHSDLIQGIFKGLSSKPSRSLAQKTSKSNYIFNHFFTSLYLDCYQSHSFFNILRSSVFFSLRFPF